MSFGLHVLTAIVGHCSFEEMNDADRLEKLLQESAEQASLTVLDTRMTRFQPHGVTGVAILSQSHIAIHTWPEEGKFFVDIATCSTPASAETVLRLLVAAFSGAVIESFHQFAEPSPSTALHNPVSAISSKSSARVAAARLSSSRLE